MPCWPLSISRVYVFNFLLQFFFFFLLKSTEIYLLISFIWQYFKYLWEKKNAYPLLIFILYRWRTKTQIQIPIIPLLKLFRRCIEHKIQMWQIDGIPLILMLATASKYQQAFERMKEEDGSHSVISGLCMKGHLCM